MESAPKSRGRLAIRGAIAVGAIAIAYAALSNFRYDYVRMNDGRSVMQFDRWFSQERVCSVDRHGYKLYCSQWRQ